MEKLIALRNLMKERGIDAYIIPSGDAHNTEYVAPYWGARKWFSGFTGSAGTVVVTDTQAGLWTDARYFIQAEEQLNGKGLDLYKMDEPDVPTYEDFLLERLSEGGKLGFDGRSMSVENFETLKKKFEPKNITYAYEEDLVGDIWANRPELPAAVVFEHPPVFAGLSASEKLCIVREKMKVDSVSIYLVTSLTDIAWLLNVRGNDIAYLPVVYSYVLITETEATIFVDKAKLADISGKLTSQGFSIDSYENIPAKLKALPVTGTIYYNEKKTNVLLAEAIPKGLERKLEIDNIIAHLKGVKSENDLTNIKNAFVKEGVAMVRLLKWLDESVKAGDVITEDEVAKMMTAMRKPQRDCLGDSFSTISAYMANGALPHYKHEGEGSTIKPEGFFLLDTGGQYLDGTTDTTRTVAVGPLTDEMKRDFTLVLKGHLAVNAAVFLAETTGVAIDALARQPVLQDRQNFKHGTGHGIGYCLGVHEGPHGVSSRSTIALVPGMLISNEPGIYKRGCYGIRTENVLAVKELCKDDGNTFLHFENMTVCPYDTRAIVAEMLTQTEKDAVNSYHVMVYKTLAPLLAEDEVAWLKAATMAI